MARRLRIAALLMGAVLLVLALAGPQAQAAQPGCVARGLNNSCSWTVTRSAPITVAAAAVAWFVYVEYAPGFFYLCSTGYYGATATGVACFASTGYIVHVLVYDGVAAARQLTLK